MGTPRYQAGPGSDASIETAYNNQVPVVSQATAEAGTSTTVYRWTPQRVSQAINALSPPADLSGYQLISGLAASVRSVALTGLSLVTAQTIAATDTILEAFGYLQAQITSLSSSKVTGNAAITGATKTKVTYDSKGLVTSGADATTTDIAEGTNLYFTNARSQSAVVTQVITNGVTATAPSEDAVYDALVLKAPLASPSFTGTVTVNDGATLAFSATPNTDTVITVDSKNISAAELGYLDGVTSAIQTQIDAKMSGSGGVLIPITASLSSSSGVVTIDCTSTTTLHTITLTENVTSWTFNNRPASGYFRDIYVEITQHASSAKTVLSPATSGRTAGGVWVQSPTLSSIETIMLRVGNSTVTLFPSGTYA